ncbi:MAG: redoxin domain-containing protein [Acidobacteria bacterium]|nr:redoxin domain-containing protein [Acidobacteriota bacterium]
MMRSGVVLLFFCLAVGMFAPPVPAVDIGAEIGDFRLSDESGNPHTLRSFSGKIVVIVFWAYKCPSAIRYTDRLDVLQRKYDRNKVVFVGVSAGSGETAAAIKANKDNLKIDFPILIDREGRLAGTLGATHIPSVFIIDGKARLQYRGAIDNDRRIGDGKRRAHAEDAIDALLAGRPVQVRETEARGCLIRP